MSSYGYEREPPRTYVREERREERVDPRYADSRAEYTRTYSRDLVPRARESSDLSIEEVRREFPPPQARDIRRTRSAEPNYYDDDDDYYDYRRDHDRRSKKTSTTMSVYREERHAPKHRSMSKQEKIIAAVAGAALLAGGKELYDRREAQQEGSSEIHRNPLASVALAGIGALAAYQGAEYYNKVQARKDQKAVAILNRGGYDSDDDMSTKEKKGQKNFLESAIAATGLGAAVKSLTGKGDGDKTRGGEPRSGGNKMQKAAMASLLAGATEAFRVAKEPGGWKGEKTRRILTAAAGAATIDSAQNKDHGKIGLAESVIGGLVGNRLINGSKNDIEEDKKTGRSRSRSRARSSSRDGGSGGTGLAALASAGLGAFGAKAAYDTYQNRSRSRAGSDDSRGRGDSPDRRRSRSRSVVDKARNSLAKLGIGNGTDDDRRQTQDDFDDRGSRRSQRRYSDEYDDDYRSNRGRDYYDDRDRSYRSRHGGDHHYDSDLGDSDEDEKKHKKMRGKSMLMSGLAAVATIHAAHSIYKGVEKREARQVAVREGKMSTEDASKLRNKALLQDAASVGLAALGIKGAISEFKEAKELSHECHEFKKQKAERHQKRIEARKQRTAPSTRQQSPNNWSSGQQHQYPESDEEDYYYHEVARTYERPQRANTLPPRAY